MPFQLVPPANRDGFVLPAVIFALAILGLLAVTALMTASDDHRSSRALRESGVALYAAEAGAHAIRAIQIDTSGTTLLDSLAATLAPGDSADLGWKSLPSGAIYRPVLHRIDFGGQRLYRLTVEGRGAGRWGGRSALTLTLTSPGSSLINLTGAMTSLSGFEKSGSSGIVSGIDNASTTGRFGCPDAGQPPIAGAFGPTNMIWESPAAPENVVTESTLWLASQPIPLVWGGTTADVAATMGIDWARLLSLTPDVMINSAADWPPASFFDGDPAPMPLIFVADGVDLSGRAGNGLLVALGDVAFGGGSLWDGLILVGGRLSAGGNTEVHGALVTGLNFLLGNPVLASDLGTGTKTFLYDSCKVAMASQAAIDKGYTSGDLTPIGFRAWSAAM